jgi:ABC-2 type transport system ATP-binding protein
MSAIQTEDLRKHYSGAGGGVDALDGLTLTVAPGTIFGFLGPNGAGKTTTIRLLTGLAHPTSGRARVAGEDIAHSRKVAARIGYLPEEPAFYPWMTAGEFLDHVGRLFSLPAAQRAARVGEMLELAGLSQVRKRRIAGFSRGMRQRLGLAQALLNRPDVLFLDEPASALDPAGRKDVLEMINGLRGQCTVFMSTHILDDVERVCDTIGIINHGGLVVEAKQADLRARYATPAFELECAEGGEQALAAWAETARTLPWVTSVQCTGPAARVVVKDVATARQALLASVVQAGLTLQRYEVVTPSLEDIFLRLVGEEGAR